MDSSSTFDISAAGLGHAQLLSGSLFSHYSSREETANGRHVSSTVKSFLVKKILVEAVTFPVLFRQCDGDVCCDELTRLYRKSQRHQTTWQTTFCFLLKGEYYI